MEEPLVIETKGRWQPFESLIKETLKTGKTYHIKLSGSCEISVSENRPTAGIKTNSIEYTKDGINKLWIKTGE